jgi:hypothetical protein
VTAPRIAQAPSSPTSPNTQRGLRNVLTRAVSLGRDDAADVQGLKARIEMQVDEERRAKKEKDAEDEAAKFREETLQVEQDERRESLKRGNRTHPDIRKLDALILQMQREEQEEHTNYLDWRDDVIQAVSSNNGERASRRKGSKGPGLVLDLMLCHCKTCLLPCV